MGKKSLIITKREIDKIENKCKSRYQQYKMRHLSNCVY
jgi:hypothetical protein